MKIPPFSRFVPLTGFGIAAFGLLLVFVEPNPGRLSIELGFLLAIFTVYCIVGSPYIFTNANFKDATKEILVTRGVMIGLGASLLLSFSLVFLGLLSLMGLFQGR